MLTLTAGLGEFGLRSGSSRAPAGARWSSRPVRLQSAWRRWRSTACGSRRTRGCSPATCVRGVTGPPSLPASAGRRTSASSTHTTPWGPFMPGARPANFGCPLILHLHDGPPATRPYRMLLRQAARDASSPDLRVARRPGTCSKTRGGDLAKACIIHNAVDLSFPRSTKESGCGRDRPPGPHIGIFGVIEPRKGQDDFLAAAARLAGILFPRRAFGSSDRSHSPTRPGSSGSSRRWRAAPRSRDGWSLPDIATTYRR